MKYFELEESNPNSLINQPAPHLEQWFIDKLVELGGKQLDGTPNLRVVWGQSERKFACGKQRIKYPSTYYHENEEVKFSLFDVDTQERTVCTFGEFMKTKEKFGDKNPNPVPQFMRTRDVDWVGIPRWIIEEYKSPLKIQDGPLNWEKNRYAMWWNPDTQKEEWTDINGPYPYAGRYEHFYTVETRDGKYKAPSETDCGLIREAIRSRETYKPKDPETYVKDFINAERKKLRKAEKELSAEIADSLSPHLNKMYETAVRFYNPGTKKGENK